MTSLRNPPALALLVLLGCSSAKVDVEPLAGEVRRLRGEAGELAADETAQAYLARSGELAANAATLADAGKDAYAQVVYLEAHAAARASIAAAVAHRRAFEAEACQKALADARREWQDALHQLEQMEKVSGREARGITRTVAEPSSGPPLPAMPPAPIDAAPAPAEVRGAAAEWKTAASRLQVPSADLESGWLAGLAAADAPKIDPGIRDARLRASGWETVVLAERVQGEASLRRCRDAEGSAASFASYRDHVLWAMVELERGMKESARRALEEEMQRMEDRQQKLFESLKQFEGKFASIRREARGTIMSLSDILFDFDKATLRREAEINLAKVAVILAQYPEMKIRIEGHTDNVGTEAYNQKLSERRAESVRAFLVENEVSAPGMETFGYGMSQPLASNATEEGRQQNRRVDLVIREQ